MNIVTDIILPIALAFIMFSLGLGLTLADFSRILLKPKEFFVGFFSQILILPIVALILVLIWPLSPEIAVGVMIIAAAPGGATSNILTSFAKGDVALSISLTAVISILSVVTIPIVLSSSLSILGSNYFSDVSLLDVALKMFIIVTVPVILGMVCSNFLSSFKNIAKTFGLSDIQFEGPHAKYQHVHKILTDPGFNVESVKMATHQVVRDADG